jgi:hypothetical protein
MKPNTLKEYEFSVISVQEAVVVACLPGSFEKGVKHII